MKIRTFLSLITIFLLSMIGGKSYAIIIEASVWELPNKQRLYCFGDFHLEEKIARKQGMQILEAAAKRGAPLIIENMFDYQGPHKIVRDYFAGESLQTLDTFRPQYYPLVHNVDHRQEKLFYANQSGISGAAMLKSVDDIIDEIRNYNDGPVLNAYRDTIVSTVEIIHEQLRTLITHAPNYAQAHANMQNNKQLFESFRNYYPEFSYANLEQLLKAYDVHLLDIRMLHYIFQHQIKQNNYPHIFVCAGRFHIASIEQVLPKLGYTKIYSASQMKDNARDTYIKVLEPERIYKAIDIPAFFTQLSDSPLELPPLESHGNASSPFTVVARLFSWLMVTLFG